MREVKFMFHSSKKARSTVGCLLVAFVLGLEAPLLGQRVKWHKSWAEAVTVANTEERALLLAITGDAWSSLSKSFTKTVLGDGGVKRRMQQDYSCYRIDLPVARRGRAKELSPEDRKLLAAVGIGGHQAVPRVILMARDERIYGRLGGPCDAKTFLSDIEQWEFARKETGQPVQDKATAARLTQSANAQRLAKDYVGGLRDSESAVAADPSNAYAHFVRGLLLNELGRKEDARQAYINGLSLDSTGDPANARTTIWAAGAWYNLGVMELAEGAGQRALFYLRENQRTDLSTDGPMKRVIELQAKVGRADVGLEEYTELLHRSGLSASYMRAYFIYADRMLGGR